MGHSTSSGRSSGGSQVFKPVSEYRWDPEQRRNVLHQDLGPLEKMNERGIIAGDKAIVTLADGSKKTFTAERVGGNGLISGIAWREDGNRSNFFGRGGILADKFRDGVRSVEINKDTERRRRNAQVMDEAVRMAERREQEERRRGREAARNMENISRRRR